jgi:hypothetical protein
LWPIIAIPAVFFVCLFLWDVTLSILVPLILCIFLFLNIYVIGIYVCVCDAFPTDEQSGGDYYPTDEQSGGNAFPKMNH